MPPFIMIILLVALLFGLYLKSCWKKQQDDILKITNIEIAEYTPGNIDIKFNIINVHDIALSKIILITVYDSEGFELASKLSKIEITARSNKRYLKVLTKFERPVNDNNKPDFVTVEIHKP